jgi:hypothetical protein
MQALHADDEYLRRLGEGDVEAIRQFEAWLGQMLSVILRRRTSPNCSPKIISNEVLSLVYASILRGDLGDRRKLPAFVRSACEEVMAAHGARLRTRNDIPQVLCVLRALPEAERALLRKALLRGKRTRIWRLNRRYWRVVWWRTRKKYRSLARGSFKR